MKILHHNLNDGLHSSCDCKAGWRSYQNYEWNRCHFKQIVTRIVKNESSAIKTSARQRSYELYEWNWLKFLLRSRSPTILYLTMWHHWSKPKSVRAYSNKSFWTTVYCFSVSTILYRPLLFFSAGNRVVVWKFSLLYETRDQNYWSLMKLLLSELP